jgi:L-cysteine:1D-myo-inositol 2-amino-2-deoxy-alpha-D-glucopyranoside ligase
VRLYNSRTRTIEPLEVRDGRVSMYVCGITPYDVTHLGHAFTYLTFDVLRRHLEAQGVEVRHVQNITDVDDDIIRKARELATTTDDLTEQNVRWFDEDMRALGALPPTATPRASQVVPQIQEMVAALLAGGHAYQDGGDVYFDVRSYPAYGQLSRLTPEEMLAENRRQQMRPGPRHPLDFLLWQASAPGEPSWESPWGRGRPGWHVECSAMALTYAGRPVDIHGGGRDLIFPHHESETAQSECFTERAPFARFWVHVGMIRYQGEKMSKSLGNLVLVRDLLRDHTPDAIRLSLLAIHYRESREWTPNLLRIADTQAARLAAAAAASEPASEPVDTTALLARFHAALDHDLDTPGAVAALLDLAGRIQVAGQKRDITEARAALREGARILGLRLGGDGQEMRENDSIARGL